MQVDIQNGIATITMPEAEFYEKFGPQAKETKPVNQSVSPRNDLFSEATFILNQINMPKNLKGFDLLRDAIIICCESGQLHKQVTKYLYPSLAKKHNDTPTRVERAIRHAIEVSWSGNNVAALNRICMTNLEISNKPTNSQFISLIVDYIQARQGGVSND